MRSKGIPGLGKQHIMEIPTLLILTGAIIIIFNVLLYVLRTAWIFYQSTPVGSRYVLMHDTPYFFTFIRDANIVSLTFKTTLISLMICLLIATAAHLLGLLSQLYIDRRIFMRIILFGIPLTWISALVLQELGLTENFQTAFQLALLPTMALFNFCFRITIKIIPDLSFFITTYPRLSHIWELVNFSLALVLISTVYSVMALYLLNILLESQLHAPFISAFHAESTMWGDIPFALDRASRIYLAMSLSLTVFFIGLTITIAGQLIHAVRGLYLNRSPTVKACVFGPIFVMISGLGVRYIGNIEPMTGALVLAVVPTFCIYQALLNHISDYVPEIGEIVAHVDPAVEHPLDLKGLLTWLKTKLDI